MTDWGSLTRTPQASEVSEEPAERKEIEEKEKETKDSDSIAKSRQLHRRAQVRSELISTGTRNVIRVRIRMRVAIVLAPSCTGICTYSRVVLAIVHYS